MSASPKTTRTDASVQDFLASVKSDAQRDAQVLVDMFRDATGDEPAMWGPSIIGFGEREIIGANGKSQTWMLLGFSPRQGKFAIYLPGGAPQHQDLLDRVGRHEVGKARLYVRKLADVDAAAIRELVDASLA